jgi:CBS domain-containing protein
MPPQVAVAERTPIRDVMTRGAITVHADLPVAHVIELLVEKALARVPVVDDRDRPIGMVGKAELLSDRGELVGDVMSPVVMALPGTTKLAEAARLMLGDHLHAVPVISDRGRVIGILSSSDVLAWISLA